MRPIQSNLRAILFSAQNLCLLEEESLKCVMPKAKCPFEVNYWSVKFGWGQWPALWPNWWQL
jgi:hypothetical protein